MAKLRRSKCPLACSLDLFGDRWSLLIFRDMMLLGKQRYKDFLASPEAISTNVLASRFKSLLAQGFIEKHADPNDKKSAVYVLTERGISLLPVIITMFEWAVTNNDGVEGPAPIIDAIKQDRDQFLIDANKRLRAQRQRQLAALSL